MKKLLFSGLVALAIVAGGAFWATSSGAKQAPEATFTTLDGRQFTTQDLRGKVVLVKFWATSCVTCVAQMPDNIEFYNTLSPRGFDLMAVAMDYDPPAYVQNFTRSRELPFPVVMDSSGEIAKAFGDVKLTPTAFLIDKQGRIVKRYLGNYNKAEFVATVEKALAAG